MKSKIGFGRELINVLVGTYFAWLCFSVYLSIKDGNQIAKLFTDLPQNLKSTPPFVLSFVYLVIFVPSIVFVSVIIFYFLLALVKNRFDFRKVEKESRLKLTGTRAN